MQMKECPRCGDRRWRVYLNAETGLGNCFVCSAGFNKATFIHDYLGNSWKDTFAHIKDAVKDQGWRPRKRHTAAVEFGEIKLPTSFALPTVEGRNLIYLEQRGITGEIARYFHLRYCETGWWNWEEDGRRRGQLYEQRVIIPVFDLDGKLVTFQGRDVTGEAERKYLFPTGLPGTGRFLFNGQNAGLARRAVLAEGAFDVFALKIALDEDVELRDVVPLGSFGKHLSYGSLDGNDQLGRFMELRQRGLREVTIMWDGEWRAVIAALDAAELLARIGLKVRIALLPSEKDPNEVSADVVRAAFKSAHSYSKALAIRWRLQNPYSKQKRQSVFT